MTVSHLSFFRTLSMKRTKTTQESQISANAEESHIVIIIQMLRDEKTHPEGIKLRNLLNKVIMPRRLCINPTVCSNRHV